MPELPEVETIRKGLENLVGKKVSRIFRSEKKLRIITSLDLQGLKCAKILNVRRRARYLLINFNNKTTLVIHLGMSGRVTLRSKFDQEKHDHFALQFDDNSWLIFNDPRRFGFIDLIESKNISQHKMLAPLGPEPLSEDFNTDYLQEKLRGKKINIKTAMMDNKIVVGVGNIYINEALFDSGISPLRCSCDLGKGELKKLVESIKKILASAIELGGSSISDYVDSNGSLGNFQKGFKVYGRIKENCLLCRNLIRKIKLNGRSSFYCTNCQK